MSKKPITNKSLADFLGVSTKTIQRYKKSGRLNEYIQKKTENQTILEQMVSESQKKEIVNQVLKLVNLYANELLSIDFKSIPEPKKVQMGLSFLSQISRLK